MHVRTLASAAALLLVACSGTTIIVEKSDSPSSSQRPGGTGDANDPTNDPAGPGDPGQPKAGDEKADGTYAFGTLATDPDHAKDEAAAGAKNAMLELVWAEYEPQKGQFDAAYVAKTKAAFAKLTAAGMRVTLALGLHMQPDWVFQIPNARFVDQTGKTADQPNLVFNQKLRNEAAAYFDRIHQDFGMGSFWAIRLTSGGSAEVLYPGDGEYWAFDPNAKNGPDMPPSMAKNPFPNWRPGQKTLTTAQVQQWADWYIGALADSVDWQMVKLSALGFKGYYQVLTPGLGARPLEYADDVKNFLPNGLTGIGAVWHELYAALPHKQNVVAYVSSMADLSNDDNVCDPGDKQIPLDDQRVMSWSAARWIARIADEHGLAKNGENPGWDAPAELNPHYADLSAKGMMAASFRQMTACGYQGMYWAHSDRLWDGTVPFSAYASAIKAANGL